MPSAPWEMGGIDSSPEIAENGTGDDAVIKHGTELVELPWKEKISFIYYYLLLSCAYFS